MRSSTDAELLSALQADSLAAFDSLYDRHAAAVYRYALKELGEAEEDAAKTIAQDVFVRAWEKRRSVTLVDGSIRGWLLRAVHFEAVRARSKAARRRGLELVPEVDLIVADMAQVEQQWVGRVESHSRLARIDALLAGTLALDRQVFRAVIEGASAEQAGQRFGLSVASVRKRLTRVRARLRSELDGPDG